MKFNTLYNICLSCILVIFFAASWLLGTMVYASESYPFENKRESISGNTVSIDRPLEPLEAVTVPREAETCDYTQSEWYYDIPLSNTEQEYIFEVCSEYDVPCELVLGIMGAESQYINGQVSSNGDWGIMQINVINHADLKEKLGVTDFLDFEQNVLCGVYMLSEYYHKYTDFNSIAMCYRYGESGAAKMWREGTYETDYTRKVVVTIASLCYR